MRIYYFYDALCGWCYGFKPVLVEFKVQHGETNQVIPISGGMITGDRIGPVGEVASYISEAYKTVEQASGVKFGEAFLKNTLAKGDAIFTSIPPARALSVFKELNPQKAFEYAADIQNGIYYYGKEPANLEWYIEVAGKYDLDKEEFSNVLNSGKSLELAEKDFKTTARFGVKGFPTMIVEQAGTYYMLTHGYSSLDDLNKKFNLLKDKIQ